MNPILKRNEKTNRIRHSQMFLKIGVLKKSLKPETLLKRDSNAGVFLYILRNF